MTRNQKNDKRLFMFWSKIMWFLFGESCGSEPAHFRCLCLQMCSEWCDWTRYFTQSRLAFQIHGQGNNFWLKIVLSYGLMTIPWVPTVEQFPFWLSLFLTYAVVKVPLLSLQDRSAPPVITSNPSCLFSPALSSSLRFTYFPILLPATLSVAVRSLLAQVKALSWK